MENTRSAVEPNSRSTRTACFETASIERSSGVFLSSASPVQLTKAVGITSVTLLPLTCSHGGTRRIPRRVAAGLERRPHAAGREARGVGLALDQLLAAELGDRRAVASRREKRVVLLGRDAGHRLEPVGVVRGAVLDGPVLQRGGDGVSRRLVERLSAGDRGAQGTIGRLRQPLLLHLVVEDEAAEHVGGSDGRRSRRAVDQRPVTNALGGFGQCCRSHVAIRPFSVWLLALKRPMTPDLGLRGEGRAERAEARIMSCFPAFRNASRE